MKSRKDVAKFISNQFESDVYEDLEKGNRFHYGRQELKQLMDYIYNSEPNNEDEKLIFKTVK